MKTQLALLIGSLLLVGTAAEAKTSISADEIAELPVLESVRTVVKMPGSMTPVQPLGYVEFNFKSCAEFNFDTEVLNIGRAMIVKVVIPKGALECMGPTTERSYSVQISSDMNPQAVVTILNPVRVTLK